MDELVLPLLACIVSCQMGSTELPICISRPVLLAACQRLTLRNQSQLSADNLSLSPRRKT